MLGLWIIVSHLLGSYLFSPRYVLHRTAGSTKVSLLHAALYVIPAIILLPTNPWIIISIFVLRFLMVRFGVIDYILWARDRMAPQDKKRPRLIEGGTIHFDRADSSDLITIHMLSLAIHITIISIIIALL